MTQARLKEVLDYEPNTGIFKWKIRLSNRAKIGALAGTKASHKYLIISIDCKRYYAHRLVWLYTYGVVPKGFIDHIDGNPSNNKLDNLREATGSQNNQNAGLSSHNTSGFKGVSWNKNSQKFDAHLKLNGKRHYLGSFLLAKDAADIYNAFAKEQHGEFYKDTINENNPITT